MHPTRTRVIIRLSEGPAGFNELWDKQGPSNAFAYHLNVLKEDGYVTHDGERYALTDLGRTFSSFLDRDTRTRVEGPLSSVAIIARRGSSVLFIERTREPFRGQLGLPAGKMRKDEYPREAAERELLEETGMSGELTLRGVVCTKTTRDDELVYSAHLFVYTADDLSGEAIGSDEGRVVWSTPHDERIIPDIATILELADSELRVLVVDKELIEGQVAVADVRDA